MRQTTEKFDNLIDRSRQGIIISNRDRKILFCNQTAAEIFGYASSDEIMALRESYDLIAPHERARLIKLRTSRFDGENPHQVIVFEGVRKNGDFIHIEGHQRRLNWEGQPAIQMAITDISEQILQKRRCAKARNDTERSPNHPPMPYSYIAIGSLYTPTPPA